MRKVLLWGMLATVAVVLTATAAVRAFMAPNDPEYAETTSAVALAGVKLVADREVSPVGGRALAPGSRYRYKFEITNTGAKPVRHVAVQSKKVLGARAGRGLKVVGVDSRNCTGRAERVDCVFPVLEPGESQTITVEAVSAATRKAGDCLTIHTFLGRYVGTQNGAVSLQVQGPREETCGTFTGRKKLRTLT